MNSPPAAVAVPRLKVRGIYVRDENPNWVAITNPIYGEKDRLKKNVAIGWVAARRAVWAGPRQDRIHLIMSHPANQRTLTKGEAKLADIRLASLMTVKGYQWPEGKTFTEQELLNIGIVRPAKAITESQTDRSVRGTRHFAGRSGLMVRIEQSQPPAVQE
jgi:hypothetical protein